MSNDLLKEKLNEISVLLVMTSDGDTPGIKMLSEMCAAFAILCHAETSYQRLELAAQAAVEELNANKAGVLANLSSFISAALEFLEGQQNVSFPNEKSNLSSEVKIEQLPSNAELTNAHIVQPAVELGSYVISGEKDILVEFAAEAEEHLANVEEIILDSSGSYTKESIDTIFRGVHSLKGGSAYFTLEEITKTSHLLESILDEVRNDQRVFDENLKNLVLCYIDLEKTLINQAKQASAGDGVLKRTQAAKDFLDALQAYSDGSFKPVTRQVSPEPLSEQVQQTSSEQPKSASNQVNTATKQDTTPKSSEESGDKNSGKSFVKIETARLDQLINSIGEMAIYSSMLVRMCREQLGGSETVLKTTSQVEKFARDLQDIGMSMRLVPIKGLFQKMQRLVWDTSKRLGKDITFEMDGEDTELDRNIIDKIADPLMHMVRNSIDHGVEPPAERTKAGKSSGGRVKLSAYHSGGTIHIAIEDDGRGLDSEKLIKKAAEKGIIREDAKLTEQEAFNLIFAPGFSTASVVTDVSGRGVGMDVVRRNVESLRGHIHINSVLGKGSNFIIEIPLTLAMIDGVEIKVGSEHFIIPSLSIVEFIRPEQKSLSCTLDHAETFFFRGKYLPVFRLADLYDIEPQYTKATDATLIVVENNQEQVALMVDEIVGEYSTVIKSLSSMFQEGKGVSGCAIMPDGSVALILDIRHLAQLARSATQDGSRDAHISRRDNHRELSVTHENRVIQ